MRLSTRKNIEVGARVRVFDPRLFKNDYETPLDKTMQSATVLRRYFYKGQEVADVRFDHDGRESKGHFTWFIKHLTLESKASDG